MRRERPTAIAVTLAATLLLALGLPIPGLSPASAGQEDRHVPTAPDPTTPAERRDSWSRHVELRDGSVFRGLEWRAIGPSFPGGRIEAIAVDPTDPATIYVGPGAGNLWKTDNGGVSWRPVFDDQPTFSIGAVAVAPSDPEVVWLGTGEVLMARSSLSGFGVFRSRDGGDTWDHRGLEATHHIAEVLVHPDDADTAWVAAIGHLFSFNQERGVYRTRDGGETWEKVLYVDDRTGAIDLVADPRDPEVLYAATWERSRRAWGHVASGPGSGIWKSTDGGDTWERLENGFPTGEHVGRIGLAVAPSRPDTVYALLDNHEPRPQDEEGRRPPRGEVYRSDDAGATWREVTEENIPAGYDFCLIAVSLDDPEQVWVPGQLFWRSDDGGRTFREMQPEVQHLLEHGADVLHLDQHELWIDPDDPDHWLLGNDGGLYETRDRGASFLHWNNLPITELYAIDVDDAEPYNVWGGTQDDAAFFGPVTHRPGVGVEDPWEHVYIDPWGGGDSYFTFPHRVEPWVVFYEHQFGALRRKDMRDGTTVDIQPDADNVVMDTDDGDAGIVAGGPGDGAAEQAVEEPGVPELRYNWMTPFLDSHFDPDTLYYGTQFVLRSGDRGDSWRIISPDLTTDPGPERQGNVPFGTLTSISESRLDSRLLWTGSDDGRVHVTRDGGDRWTDVSAGLPDKWVSRVVASTHDPERAYVSLTGYRDDDWTAYLFVTDDGGAAWSSLAAGLPAEPINVVREDPTDPDILYVGTDLGAYVSVDRGGSWHGLMGGLPTTPVHDLAVHPREPELVAGTHGRSAFVVDVSAIRAWTPAVAADPLHLFAVEPAVRPRGRDPAPYRSGTTSGAAVIRYAASAAGPVTVEIRDGQGEIVRTLADAARPGVNVVHWDLLPEEGTGFRGAFGGPPPWVAAGTYRVVVQAGDTEASATLVVLGP